MGETMSKIRVLIVDDSPFSQALVKAALPADRFEVCGVASTAQQGIALYQEIRPDVVTMDVTMPDIDGLECSRAILSYDRHAQIVLLSAMKDERLIAQGRVIGIRDFLQKPVDPAALAQVLENIVTEKDLAVCYPEQHADFFIQALETNLQAMAGYPCQCHPIVRHEGAFITQGIAIIIGITGPRTGRLILAAGEATAASLIQNILKKEMVTNDEILHGMAEFANIIAGHGVSKMNNTCGSESRLTPASILFGETLNIFNPKLESHVIAADTAVGPVYMNIGFGGGIKSWM